jgi:hypothetical protein
VRGEEEFIGGVVVEWICRDSECTCSGMGGDRNTHRKGQRTAIGGVEVSLEDRRRGFNGGKKDKSMSMRW